MCSSSIVIYFNVFDIERESLEMRIDLNNISDFCRNTITLVKQSVNSVRQLI